jgi:DNA-binding XRE family transcriptional regulator
MSTKSETMSFLEGIVGPLTFGVTLAAIRKCEEISQSELAKRAGVTPATLCDLEKGRRLPSLELAAKYARILGHDEALFVRLALQDQVHKAGLKYEVEVKAA